MEGTTAASFIPSAIAIAIAIGGGLFYGRRLRLELQKEAQSEIRKQQREQYEEFRSILVEFLGADERARNRSMNDAKVRDRLRELATSNWLVASAEVLNAFNEWRYQTQRATPDEPPMLLLADLIGAMRRDLALATHRTTRRAILATIINNIDEVGGDPTFTKGLNEPAGYFASRGTWRWPVRRIFLRTSKGRTDMSALAREVEAQKVPVPPA